MHKIDQFLVCLDFPLGTLKMYSKVKYVKKN